MLASSRVSCHPRESGGPGGRHSALPLFHTARLNVFANPVFHAGGTVVVMPSYDPEQTLRLIGDPLVGVTHLYGVPAHYQFMAQSPGFASTDLSRLVSAGVGSAPAPLAPIEAWAANLGRYKLPRSVVFVEALPRNATSKVHKPTLRTHFGAGTMPAAPEAV